jgi:hypothetical protein
VSERKRERHRERQRDRKRKKIKRAQGRRGYYKIRNVKNNFKKVEKKVKK